MGRLLHNVHDAIADGFPRSMRLPLDRPDVQSIPSLADMDGLQVDELPKEVG